MGVGMAARGRLRGATAVQAIAITAGAMAIDLSAFARRT
jgi:hypothetical protein